MEWRSAISHRQSAVGEIPSFISCQNQDYRFYGTADGNLCVLIAMSESRITRIARITRILRGFDGVMFWAAGEEKKDNDSFTCSVGVKGKSHDWGPTRVGKPLLRIESPKFALCYLDEMRLILPDHHVRAVLTDFVRVL